MANPFITTYTGKRFHLLRPHVDEIDITSIARSIATKPRYAGQALETETVLDHLLFGYKIAEGPVLKLHWLMHDLHEAYSGDVTAPLKSVLYVEMDGEFVPLKAFENKLTEAIYQHFGIPLPTAEMRAKVDRLDLLVRAVEMRHFFTNHPCLTNGQTAKDILDESARYEAPIIHDQRGAWRLFCDVFKKAVADYWRAVQR